LLLQPRSALIMMTQKPAYAKDFRVTITPSYSLGLSVVLAT